MMKNAAIVTAMAAGANAFAGGSGTCSHVLSSISGMVDRTRETGTGDYVFSFTPAATDGYTPGDTYEVTLKNDAKVINGFLAYAVAVNAADPATADRVGTIAGSTGSQVKDCPAGPTATHEGGDALASVSFSWTAPAAGTGAVDFFGISYNTMEKTFWNPMITLAEAADAPTKTIVELLVADPDYSELKNLVTDAANKVVLDALEACTECTLFAPNNAAIQAVNTTGLDAAALIKVLTYHLVTTSKIPSSAITTKSTFAPTANGKSVRAWSTANGVMIGGSTTGMVQKADWAATNGVIHGVNAVLMPPMSVIEAVTMVAPTAAAAIGKIPDVATLLTADQTATIFAPNDAAVTAAFADPAVALLLGTEPVKIFSYHVVSGSTVFSNDLAEGTTDVMSTGTLAVNKNQGAVTVNGADVVKADVFASNGVLNIAIHFIDEILIEPEPTMAPTPELSPAASVSPVAFFAAAAAGALALLF